MNVPQINLPNDLPENWTNGQIVSPSGMDVGLSQEHGYNYLNKSVNMVKTALSTLRAFFSGSGFVGTADLGNSVVTWDKLADDARDSTYKKAQAAGYTGTKEAFYQKLAQMGDPGYIPTTEKGAGGGVATLDTSGKLSSSQIPALSYLPLTGGTLTGNLRLKNNTAFGMKLNFGDGDYVYISEPVDDVMEIHAKEIRFTGGNQASQNPLPLILGGVGATTPSGARTNLGAVTGFGPVTVTLTASGWSGSGPWTQTVTVSGVTASDNHLHVYPVDIADDAARKLYDKAYGCLSVQAETVAGGVKFTCRSAKPATNFQVRIEGVR